jgi:hypothetical protein
MLADGPELKAGQMGHFEVLEKAVGESSHQS